MTASLVAFFQYKGSLLWVTAHYNTVSSPTNLTRRKLECVYVFVCVCACPFLCLSEHKSGCISSPSAFMPCLPMLLFVSIFTFAYAVRYLSYAQTFQVSSHSPSSHTHTFTHTHTHTHTYTQSSDMRLMNTPNYVKTHSSSLYLSGGWRRGQKLRGDGSEGSRPRFRIWQLLNLFFFFFFFFVLFIR